MNILVAFTTFNDADLSSLSVDKTGQRRQKQQRTYFSYYNFKISTIYITYMLIYSKRSIPGIPPPSPLHTLFKIFKKFLPEVIYGYLFLKFCCLIWENSRIYDFWLAYYRPQIGVMFEIIFSEQCAPPSSNIS